MDVSLKQPDGSVMTTMAVPLAKGCDTEELWKDIPAKAGGRWRAVLLSPLASSMSSSSSSSLVSAASSDEGGKGTLRKEGMVEGNNEDSNRKRKVKKKKMGRKEMEGMEMERKETVRKETERKELEGKELERKESEGMEMEGKETDGVMEKKGMEKKAMDGKEKERKELDKKETERKETERKEIVRMEMDRKEMDTVRMETNRKEIERKESARKEMKRKEMESEVTNKKMLERKIMERKETERKDMERKDVEKCEIMIKEGTMGLVARLHESERENTALKEEIRRLKSSLHLCLEGLLKADAAVKTAQSTVLGLLVSEGNALPPLIREEFSSLPPLMQRTNRNSIASGGGVRASSVVQSPPPMVNRGFEGAETSGETYKDGGSTVSRVGLSSPSKAQVSPSLMEHLKEEVTSSAMSGQELGWKLVGGGRRRRKFSSSPPSPDSGMELSGQHLKSRPRPTLASAVSIAGRTEGFSYAEVLRNARQHIDLEALGIGMTHVRQTANGGCLIEVLGEDSRRKAEVLSTRLREIFKDSAKISCPSGKKRELRITGFDKSVLAEEIVEVLSSFGGCSKEDVWIGSLRTLHNGLGTVRVQLPVAAVTKLVDAESVRLGWTTARVELKTTRPLQCYRCWRYGHVRSSCHSLVDRKDACYKCGQLGHMANSCQNTPHCVICHDDGMEAAHYLGGPYCGAQMQPVGRR